MNESVRNCPIEKMYPLSAMTEYTENNIVDVASFCRDNNTAATRILVAAPQGAITSVTVDLTPSGQDENHHYPIQLIPYWPLEISVKTIYLTTSSATAAEIFILGINP